MSATNKFDASVFVPFNSNHVYKYQEYFAGFGRIIYKPKFDYEMLEICNGSHHLRGYFDFQENFHKNIEPCYNYTRCPVYNLRPNSKLPACPDSLAVRADSGEIIGEDENDGWMDFSLTYLGSEDVFYWSEQCQDGRHWTRSYNVVWDLPCSPEVCRLHNPQTFA